MIQITLQQRYVLFCFLTFSEYFWGNKSLKGGNTFFSFFHSTRWIFWRMTVEWTDHSWIQSDPCEVTHCVLLLLSGITVQAVCPSRIWWVLEVIAGLKGDWNSHPHTVSSVWPSGGAVRGKNCINQTEYIVAPIRCTKGPLNPGLETSPHPSDPRQAGFISPATLALTLPRAHSRTPATAHELWGCQAHGAGHEVLTAWSSLGHLIHLHKYMVVLCYQRAHIMLTGRFYHGVNAFMFKYKESRTWHSWGSS